MSYRLVQMVLESSLTDATEVAVMIAIASHADKFYSCYPSISRICTLSRYKERAVQGAIKRLSDRRFITVKTGGGRGGASFYTINPAALNPAADAPIGTDKPRSKNPVLKTETPQQMRETPHLTTENPAADADEPIKEPIKNMLASSDSRESVVNLIPKITHALGFDLHGQVPKYWISPDAALIVGRWKTDLGLTNDEIVQVAVGNMRAHGSPANGPKTLIRDMQDFAAAKNAPPLTIPTQPKGGSTHDRPTARDRRAAAADDAFVRVINAAAGTGRSS